MSGAPAVARTAEELRAVLVAAPRPVHLVPTMGALHAGHASLIRAAGEGAGTVVASIFVNPRQFGPGEDLDRYPRTFDADLDLCGECGAGIVFAPSASEMYPDGFATTVRVAGPLTRVLEGTHRPGHFDGVATVVAKLFGLVRPDAAVFGEKDWQQLAVVRQTAADLNLGVDVVGRPTVREADGLALSSRNRYLSAADRAAAAELPRRLTAAGFAVDYAVARDPATLGPPPTGRGAAVRLLVAASIGGTRLIDNAGATLPA